MARDRGLHGLGIPSLCRDAGMLIGSEQPNVALMPGAALWRPTTLPQKQEPENDSHIHKSHCKRHNPLSLLSEHHSAS